MTRRILAVVLASVASAAVLVAQQPPPVRSDQDILIQLERDWDAAFHRHDVAFIDRLLAEEFVVTYDTGVRADRNVELQHLTTALDMDAQNGVVASELAYLAMELQNLDVAQRALRAITMLKVPAPLPKALAYQHLGEIARQQGDVKRAMMLLKRAIDDDPSLQSARILLDALHAES